MQIKKLHITLLLSLCAALAACSDQDVLVDDIHNGKTPIEVSAAGSTTQGQPSTRAVIIDGKGKITAFEKDTRLHMLMVSQNGSTTDTKWTVTYGLAKGSGKAPADLDDDATQWTDDDKFSVISFDGTRRSTQTYTDPANELGGSTTATDNNAYEGSWRYWDDAYARTAKVSVYGMCVANTILPNGAPWNQKINNVKSNFTPGWNDDASGIDYKIGREAANGDRILWTIGKHDSFNSQTFQSVLYKDDVCYSNNISNDGGTDNRMWFNHNVSGKFDKGNLEFHRAMSLITIKLYHGAGFDNTSTSNFKFDTGKNIQMKGFNKAGLLNIKTGEWSDIVKGGWNTICNTDATPVTGGTNPAYTLLAFTIPGNDLKAAVDANNPADALTISIDGNEYKVSKKDLYDAIAANGANCEGGTPNGTVKSDYLTDGTKLKAGINYEFSFIIGKKEIDAITAQIVDWKTITAAPQTPSNAHIDVSVKTNEDAQVTGSPTFALYRAPGALYNGAATVDGYNNYEDYNWEKGYEKSTGLGETSTGTGIYTTEWYWPNNQTFYHFRTISPQNESISGNDATTYISMTGGVIKEGSVTAKDYIWGAPFKSTVTTSTQYSPISGFCNNDTKEDGQIYKAIGATEKEITLIQHHMTSQVYVDLATTTGTDAVNLTGATVELINIAKEAKLYLGNGLVTDHSNYGNVYMTADHQAEVTTEPNKHPEYDYSYGVLPQSLSNSSGNNNGKVGLKITAADGNVYFINDLSTIREKGTTGNIEKWLPGKKYYYKIVLKKTGITNIQATIVEWETVTAGEEEVQIQ